MIPRGDSRPLAHFFRDLVAVIRPGREQVALVVGRSELEPEGDEAELEHWFTVTSPRLLTHEDCEDLKGDEGACLKLGGRVWNFTGNGGPSFALEPMSPSEWVEELSVTFVFAFHLND
jgi:hypothetical protein